MYPILAWPIFFLCAATIAFVGPILVRNADVIGWRSNVTRSWIGLILLSTATSLPELITGVSAITIAGAPDIAVGDVFGSCMFNLLMIVILDSMLREKTLYVSVAQGHILTAGYGVIAIAIAGAAILITQNETDLTFASISVTTPIIFLIYFTAIRSAYRYEGHQSDADDNLADYSSISLTQAIARYVAAAITIVIAATILPIVAVEISTLMGWTQTFVGTLFVAAATSLPELVVSISALRMRALDLAIANLLGSNLFNILVLGVDDIAYRQGSLYSAASDGNAITALLGIIMSGIFIVALISQTSYRIRGKFSLASIYLFSVYAIGIFAMFFVNN